MAGGMLLVVGVDGMVEGEVFRVPAGSQVVVGRSRSCDISLRKCLKYLSLDPEERAKNKHFQTVSRQHLQISVERADHIEIENLGANGSTIDGQPLEKLVINNLADEPRELVLGTKEKFRLEWNPEDGAETSGTVQ
jgi:pSer/pThr/pTyr-binding forkhead associated (FHA) protein